MRPTSHKKKKQTHKDTPNSSLHLEDAKRHLSLDTWSVVTPVVTQTQGEEAPGSVSTDYPPQLFPLIVGPKTTINQLPLPLVANKRALSELVSGYKSSSRFKLLLVHKESWKKMKVARLNDNVLFTFLHDPIDGAIACAPDFKPHRPSNHLKKANSHFEKMGYDTSKSKLPNEKGKSKWIASQFTKPATIVAPSKGDTLFYLSFRQMEYCRPSIDPSTPAIHGGGLPSV
jgi:hypothetical protein